MKYEYSDAKSFLCLNGKTFATLMDSIKGYKAYFVSKAHIKRFISHVYENKNINYLNYYVKCCQNLKKLFKCVNMSLLNCLE